MTTRPRLRGRVWIWLLLLFAFLRLYVRLRELLIRHRISAELLTECGEHDGPMRFRDLRGEDGLRPVTTDD